MKKIATSIIALALCAIVAVPAMAANQVRISQIYGAGGNTGATWGYDYIELFNSGGTAVNIGGWSLQYGSATGTTGLGGCTNCNMLIPAGTVIQPCSYWLIQLAGGATVTTPLPVVADYVVPSASAMNLSGTVGKVALVSQSAAINDCVTNIVDLVGFGTGNCFEGTNRAPALTTTNADFRNNGGMTDTDSNVNDFTSLAAMPRNGATVSNPACLATPAPASTWGKIKTLYR